MVIADKTFTVSTSREKVWDYLTKALLRSIPFEQIQFSDERGFSALLGLKMAFLTLPVNVRLEITDMVEPETFAARIKLRGMAGIVQVDKSARFEVKYLDDEKTEVRVKLEAMRMSLPLRTVFLWKVKSFARDSLDSVECLLREWE